MNVAYGVPAISSPASATFFWHRGHVVAFPHIATAELVVVGEKGAIPPM